MFNHTLKAKHVFKRVLKKGSHLVPIEHVVIHKHSGKPAMHKKDGMVNKCADHSEASYHAEDREGR